MNSSFLHIPLARTICTAKPDYEKVWGIQLNFALRRKGNNYWLKSIVSDTSNRSIIITWLIITEHSLHSSSVLNTVLVLAHIIFKIIVRGRYF